MRDFVRPHGDERALDVGTGAGALAFALAPLVREVVGLDPVPELLELARARSLPNTEFVEGDGAALPFSDAAFDLAGTHRTLHHVAQPERVVAELARVTRPGGRVVVTLPHAAAYREDWREAPVYADQGGSPGRHFFQRWYDRARLERLAAAAPGLELVSSCASRMDPNLNELYTRTFPLLVPLGPVFGLLARRVDGPCGDVVRLTFRRR